MIRRLLTPYVRLRNAIDYPLRRRLRLSGSVRVAATRLDAALAELRPEEAAHARGLIAQYGLEQVAARGRRRDALENLYYLELLVAALEIADAPLPERLGAIDVGVSDWSYAPALLGALTRWRGQRTPSILGFETDPGRRYGDGRTREAWARWHTADLPGVTYVPDDARDWHGPGRRCDDALPVPLHGRHR